MKKVLVALLAYAVCLLSACTKIDDAISNISISNTSENTSQTVNNSNHLQNMFAPDKSANFEVIFFDTDNKITENGEEFSNYINTLSKSNNCSDCYMIKSGNTEILIDCGGQLNAGTDDNRVNNFCNNIYKKLVTYCTDGVLDYLIVTHADSDHIKNLVVDGGFFDSILDNEKWMDTNYKRYTGEDSIKNVFGETANPITSISNIIDFDSYRVRYDSTNIGKSNLLISTEIYKKYQTKRDKVITKCETTYCPASYLFSEVTGDTKDPKYHNYYAMPTDYYLNRLNDKGYSQNFKTYIGDVKNTVSNQNYKMPKLSGLNLVLSEKGNRYTYDINLENNTQIRYLYNWYYDSYYSTSNGYGQWADNRSGQPENNICVCFLVQNNENKLLILGDLGTYGEDGLLRYYGETDVLSNVSCFKASHHGSTTSRQTAEGSTCSPSENSKKLYDTICGDYKKLNLIVTGVAQPSRKFFEEQNITSVNESLYSSLSGVALIEKKLFENIGTHDVDIYCTQIVRTDDLKGFYNQPFYGDIHVIFKSNYCDVKYSYCGDIKTYIKRETKEDDPIYTFKTNSTPLEDLEWAQLVNLK